MFDKVTVPDVITQEWLDQAFAPIRSYLSEKYPDKSEKIVDCLMFISNDDGKFYYKNRWSRTYIILD
jgi:hypothetical protein